MVRKSNGKDAVIESRKWKREEQKVGRWERRVSRKAYALISGGGGGCGGGGGGDGGGDGTIPGVDLSVWWSWGEYVVAFR